MWRRWNRDAAITERMPEVARIAKRVQRLFTHAIDIEDLIQAGYVGLVSAANTFHPSMGEFPAFAYFRIRGAMIDSQKRRAFREQQNESLNAISDAYNGWLPPALDTCPAPRPDELAQRSQIEQRLARAIAGLPEVERTVLLAQLAGQPLGDTAKQMGRSIGWIRTKLGEARELVGVAVRGEG